MVYAILAVFVGLLLVLLPLVTIIGVEAESHLGLPRAFSENQAGSAGPRSKQSGPSTSEVESLALSFAIAVLAFMFLRRRTPRHERIFFGQVPYWF
jgi:hypothetical protein